jgi:arylsulfatase
MATCVDLSGATYPKEYTGNKIQPMEGRSLRPSFTKDRLEERVLMWEHFGNAAIRKGKWKLVRLGRKDWELYDIEKDRSELNALTKQQTEKAKELGKLWEKHAHRTRILPRPRRRKR